MSNEVNLKVSAEYPEDKPKYSDWEIDDAVRTLIRAEEIKQDPELMAFVNPKFQKKVKAANDAAKILYGQKQGEKNEG